MNCSLDIIVILDDVLKPIYENDAEKEFINSIVQAELRPRQSGRSALPSNFSVSVLNKLF